MPLQHIQLRPKPERESPVARAISGPRGELPTGAYAGPGGARTRPSLDPMLAGAYGRQQFPQQPTRGLAGALSTEPSWEQMKDEAYAKRDAIVAEAEAKKKQEEAELEQLAFGTYERLLGLDDEGVQMGLSALNQYRPEVAQAMIQHGLLSPDGMLARPKEVFQPLTDPIIGAGGFIEQPFVDDYGNVKTEIIGHMPMQEEVEAQLSPDDQKKLMEIQQRYRAWGMEPYTLTWDAMKGSIPIPGVSVVGDRPATEEDFEKWLEVFDKLIQVYGSRSGVGMSPENEMSIEDMRAEYEGKPAHIYTLRNQLGLTPGSEWDEELEAALKTYGFEAPPGGAPKTTQEKAEKEFNKKAKDWMQHTGYLGF